jgi:anti-sigma regulatory factor (Ser/Thr protein kinase)
VRELSLHVLDLLQNSLEAGATAVSVLIEEDSRLDRLTIEVADDGHGMPEDVVRAVVDPFVTSRKTRRVGLGIPLLAAAAERCNGHVDIESTVGVGTKVTAVFQLSHIDRAPLGDMADTLLSVLLQEPPVALLYRHRVDDRWLEFDTTTLAAELGDTSFSHPLALRRLRNYLAEGFSHIYVGGANANNKIPG